MYISVHLMITGIFVSFDFQLEPYRQQDLNICRYLHQSAAYSTRNGAVGQVSIKALPPNLPSKQKYLHIREFNFKSTNCPEQLLAST